MKVVIVILGDTTPDLDLSQTFSLLTPLWKSWSHHWSAKEFVVYWEEYMYQILGLKQHFYIQWYLELNFITLLGYLILHKKNFLKQSDWLFHVFHCLDRIMLNSQMVMQIYVLAYLPKSSVKLYVAFLTIAVKI